MVFVTLPLIDITCSLLIIAYLRGSVPLYLVGTTLR
jgi:hypothetical protein